MNLTDDRPGADDLVYDRLARSLVCGSVREQGVMRQPWTCTRDDHDDPWHEDIRLPRARWCGLCGCEAGDHHTVATLAAAAEDELLSCGSCGACMAVCA